MAEDNLIKNFQKTKQSIAEATTNLAALVETAKNIQSQFKEDVEQKVDDIRFSKFNKEYLDAFFDEPYVVIPRKANEWYVIAPKFVDFQIGWLERSTKSYNLFLINKYMHWLAEVPEKFREKFNFKPPLPLKVIDGVVLTGREHQEEAWSRYKKHFTKREGKDRIKIKRGHEFRLIAAMIDDGILPFIPKPVDKKDLRQPSKYPDWFSEIICRKYVQDAKKKFMDNGAIGVYWPYSAGKSIFGTYLCDIVKGPKLVVVPTTTLKEQWSDRISDLTQAVAETEVITYHSYEKVKNREYALTVFDECLTGDSIIVTEDGGIRPIKDILDGDRVVGGEVKSVFSRKTERILRIESSFGPIKTTETHPHFAIERERDKHLSQYKHLTSGNVKIKLAKELVVGDCLLVADRIPHTVKNDLSGKLLAFVSLIICDGHVEEGNNVIKVCVSKDDKKKWVRKIFIDGLNSFGVKRFWEFENKRGDYTIGCSSRKIRELLIGRFKVPVGKKSNRVDIVNEIFYAPTKSLKKFIDIALSCEGWVWIEKNRACRLYISMTSKQFIKKLQLLLKKFGIHAYLNSVRRRTLPHNDMYRLSIGGKDLRKLMDEIKLTHSTKSKKMIRNKEKFMNDIVSYKGKKYRIAKIKSIRRLGSNTVYDFETTSHRFLANGFLTHNCHHLPANSFSRLATIKTKYRIGVSGSVYREDGRTDYIFALTGLPVGMDWHELLETQVIQKPSIYLYILKDQRAKMSKLAELLTMPVRTIVFCDSIDLGQRISEKFGIPHVYGATRNRIDIIKESEMTVVSRVGDEGISLPNIERVIEVDFLYSSRRQEGQRLGRLFHGEKEGEHIILMTDEEYEKYEKRLYAIYEKGFRIDVRRG